MRMIRQLIEQRWWGIPAGLWAGIVFFIAAFVCINLYRYAHFMYFDYDLGIFSQVLWNTVHGRVFEYSFAPYSYLVDHRSWLLMLFVPLYWAVGHPMALVVVQTVGIAAAAVPLYFFAHRIFFNAGMRAGRWALVVGLLFLANPIVHSMALYEFHMLPFLMLIAFSFWLFVEQKRWGPAVVCFVLMLLLREDTAIAASGAALLIAVRHGRSHLFKALVLFVVSVAWFGAMMWVGNALAPSETTKFLQRFYDFGETPVEALQAIVTQPVRAASTFFGKDHLLALFFLLATFGFLPLWRARYLLPLLGPAVLYLFMTSYLYAPLVRTQHAAPFVVWLTVAALYGAVSMRGWLSRVRLPSWIARSELKMLAWIVVGAVMAVQYVIVSQLMNIPHTMSLVQQRDIDGFRSVISQVGGDDAVFASNRFYDYFSNREALYPTFYFYTGKRHFTTTPYEFPEKVDWILVEYESVARWAIGLPFEDREPSAQRLREVMERNGLYPVESSMDFVAFGKVEDGRFPVPLVEQGCAEPDHEVGEVVNGDLLFIGWSYHSSGGTPDGRSGELQLGFEKVDLENVVEEEEYAELRWLDADGEAVMRKLIPLGMVVDPTYQWDETEEKKRTVYLPLKHPDGAEQLELTIGEIKGQGAPFFTGRADTPVIATKRSASFFLSEVLHP